MGTESTREKHLDVLNFEKNMRTQEVEKLGAEISDKKDMVDELSERIANLTDCEAAISKISETFETGPDYQLPEP